jgi:alkylated DNA nucleotide flippase Atl1
VPTSPDVILDRVRRVPPGFVTTYGDLSPGAPRLAGRVLSHLPVGARDVPWWRVVRSDCTLAIGSEQRARLLEEDVPMRGARVDLAAARIPPEAIL